VGGFYTGVQLGAFASSLHPHNFHVDLDHLRRIAEQTNANAAKFTEGYIEIQRARVEHQGQVDIIRETMRGAAHVASQARPVTSELPQLEHLIPQAQVDHVTDGQGVLTKSCYKCHNTTHSEGGLDLTDASAITPELWDNIFERTRLTSGPDMMPPEDSGKPPLTTKQIELLYDLKAHLRKAQADPSQPEGN